MLRVLFFLALVAAIGSALAFVAAQSGELVLMVAGQRIVLPLFTAVCAVLIIIAAFLFLLWLVQAIIRTPRILRNHFGFKREQRGHQALSQGLIAAMSGDRQAAHRLTRQSQALLTASKEPLLPLLVAETKRLELDYQGAEEIFQSMLENPQTKLIGLKGLYREALRKGEEDLAGLYAEQAVEIDAALEWAVRASITHYAVHENWHDALRLLDKHNLAIRPRHRSLKKSDMAHWQIVLNCASAHSLLPHSPQLARDVALRAHKAEPTFVPAATIAAKSLLAVDERKKAEKLIETFWRKNPHPDLGMIYIEADITATVHEKLRRAERLEKLKPDHPTSQFLVAQAALGAGDTKKAQQYSQRLAEESPSESIFLLLADIHAALGSSESTIRHYLMQAAHAPADFTWMADGQLLAEWVAISPLSHRIGGCEWQQPLKQAPPLLALPEADNLERFPKNGNQILNKKRGETQELEHLTSSGEDKTTSAPQPAETISQESIAISPPAETENKPEQQQEPPMPIFLPDQEPVKKRRNKNVLPTPPTRIVVDDPGIIEEDDKG